MTRQAGPADTNHFKKISINYDAVHGRVHSAVYKILQEHYYPRCTGKRILDVGNGGQSPSDIFGSQIVRGITGFVGLDNSVDMLERKKGNYARVIGSGLQLPFKDKAFDYVICNGVIHHLGFSSQEGQALRVKQFINECMRVCRNEVIVYEMVTARYLEQVQRLAARVLGYMPTFVLSEFTINKYLNQINVSRKEVISKTLSDLTSPFYWYAVIMDYEFFKLPAFLSFFRNVFFVSPVVENRTCIDGERKY